MRRMKALGAWLLMLGLLSAGGCGGLYTVTVPDQLAPPGEEMATVVRLQRSEVYLLSASVNEALMRFQIGEDIQRGAYTDKFGYAGTTVPVPAELGQYTMTVSHIDRYGDEAIADGQVYVWDANQPIVAVDMDSLPGLFLGNSEVAAHALDMLASEARLVYLTRRSARDHPEAHRRLSEAGYPEGPILAWQRQRWHITRDGWLSLPRIVVESRLVSQLTEVGKVFPNMTVGVCTSALAAKAFAEAGMGVVVVGSAGVDVPAEVRRRKSWAELADLGP